MKRLWPVIAVSIPAVAVIWIVAPCNTFLLHNGHIGDDYLTPIATFLLLLIVLLVNPLLGRLSKSGFRFLDGGQLALVFGILMMATVLGTGGLNRHTLFALPKTVHRANTDARMADAYKELDPPASLFPDSLEYGTDIPNTLAFVDELRPGQSLPYRAWLPPLLSWCAFALPWYLTMMAMAVIFFSYWRDVERVPFPLLGVLQKFVALPKDGGRLPTIFRSRAFWVSLGIVVLLHSLRQGNRYLPDRMPGFPLNWSFEGVFSENPWRHMGWWMKSGAIFFSFLGIAFFVPTRISLSVWIFQVVYAIYMMLGTAYAPPFDFTTLRDHRLGATLAFPLCVLWMARRHLANVARAVVKPGANPDNRAYRVAGVCLLAGMLGMIAWLRWVNVPLVWAICITLTGFLTSLAMMRVVAETGLPLFYPPPDCFIPLASLIPLAWRTHAGMYFSGVMAAWFGPGQRVCVATAATHAMGLNKEIKPRGHAALGGLFMLVLILTILGAGIVCLNIGYRNSSTPGGAYIADWSSAQLNTAENFLLANVSGSGTCELARSGPRVLFGAGLTTLLYGLCQLTPYWPIHPVGMLSIGSWSVMQIWPNVFLGWLCKVLVLRYGGPQLYRRLGVVFIGLVAGEVIAAIGWALFSSARAASGLPYFPVNILPY